MTTASPDRRTRLLAGAMPLLLVLAAVPAAARSGTLTPGSLDSSDLTVAAIPSETTRATVRPASATGFRPAPVPDEALVQPETAKPDDDAGSLHPELLGPHEVGGGGALSSASSEYDHNARFRPAGGMGVTIPMQ